MSIHMETLKDNENNNLKLYILQVCWQTNQKLCWLTTQKISETRKNLQNTVLVHRSILYIV